MVKNLIRFDRQFIERFIAITSEISIHTLWDLLTFHKTKYEEEEREDYMDWWLDGLIVYPYPHRLTRYSTARHLNCSVVSTERYTSIPRWSRFCCCHWLISCIWCDWSYLPSRCIMHFFHLFEDIELAVLERNAYNSCMGMFQR